MDYGLCNKICRRNKPDCITPLLIWRFRRPMILGDVHSYFVTDDSAQVIAPISKGEAFDTLDCFTVQDGGDILYRKASNELPTTPSKISNDRRPVRAAIKFRNLGRLISWFHSFRFVEPTPTPPFRVPSLDLSSERTKQITHAIYKH